MHLLIELGRVEKATVLVCVGFRLPVCAPRSITISS